MLHFHDVGEVAAQSSGIEALNLGAKIIADNTTRTYVDRSECASCHDAIADSYAQTGMAHSFYSADKQGSLQTAGAYYHSASRTWFSMEWRDGRLYQKRWQQGETSETINLDSELVDYVMGSGSHVRTRS